MEFWEARDIVLYQKKFKRQSLTDKVLPDVREKALMNPIQKSAHLGLPVVQPKDWQLVFIFSLGGQGLAAL